MKNPKLIEIIDKFPTILYRLRQMMKSRKNVDYILDASDYVNPVSLLKIIGPDILLLTIRPAKSCVDLLGKEMQNNYGSETGMITSDPTTYYMSLCSTLNEEYIADKSIDLELMPQTVSRLQLN